MYVEKNFIHKIYTKWYMIYDIHKILFIYNNIIYNINIILNIIILYIIILIIKYNCLFYVKKSYWSRSD